MECNWHLVFENNHVTWKKVHQAPKMLSVNVGVHKKFLSTVKCFNALFCFEETSLCWDVVVGGTCLEFQHLEDRDKEDLTSSTHFLLQ